MTVTAFFSSIPKIILFALITRLYYLFFSDFICYSESLLIFSGLASVCFASVATLYQKRLKRLLAYSAISHTGFILLSICCGSIDSMKSTLVYIFIYVVMTLSIFSVIFLSSNKNKIPKFLINWTSIASQNLCLAITFSIILFSVAGIPPLAGFFSKLSVFGSLLFKDYLLTSVTISIFSSIACFYYIRLIRIFFFTEASLNNDF